MNKFAKMLLKSTAKISKKAAVKSCGATSFIGCYQPKEPKALQNLKK